MSVASPSMTVVVSVFAALLAGTVYRVFQLYRDADDVSRKRIGSLISWWLVSSLVIGCSMVGRGAVVVLLAVVGCLGLQEFAKLARPNPPDNTMLSVGWIAVGVLYFGLAAGLGIAWILAIPLGLSIVAGLCAMATRPLEAFSSSVAAIVYGVGLIACLPAMTVLAIDRVSHTQWSGAMFLLIVGLTQWNDILSAWAGRSFGRRKFAPVISPNKTVEGFVGGLIGTIATAALIGPPLATLSLTESVLLGAVIALAGTLGDLNMSAIKRSAGVKDSGWLLPGQGGVLDRIDSLTFTAPAVLILLECFLV